MCMHSVSCTVDGMDGSIMFDRKLITESLNFLVAGHFLNARAALPYPAKDSSLARNRIFVEDQRGNLGALINGRAKRRLVVYAYAIL